MSKAYTNLNNEFTYSRPLNVTLKEKLNKKRRTTTIIMIAIISLPTRPLNLVHCAIQ